MDKKHQKRKYDYDAISNDYKSGLSLPKLVKKYSVSLPHAHRICIVAGVMRSQSEAAFIWYGINLLDWHKLQRVNNSETRVLSLPFSTLKKLGFKREQELIGKWVIENKKLFLEIKVKK